jgi:formamidopyrimidine-DNA glycosylase
MYQARLHPEQYSNTFSDEQIKRLHDAIMYVCDTAVGTLAESDKFPKDWLMKYRWDKGKKSGSQLPNGAKITFLTVGGRTSAIVPSVQKKTAAVAGDVSDGAESEGGGEEEEEEVKPKRAGKRKAKDLEEDTAPGAEAKAGGGGGRKTRATENNQDVKLSTKAKRGRKANEADIKEESGAENDEDEDEAPTAKKSKSAPAKKSKTAEGGAVKVEDTSGRRRSGRLAK